MRSRSLLILSILTTLFLGGQTPSPLQRQNVQRDLTTLTKRGFTYRMLDNNLIELTDPVSGEKRLKSLREPNEATIRAWASQRGIPILEIDPNTIDTSKYTGWYRYWSTVPLSNGSGFPLMVGDLNQNGKTDVYGYFRDSGIIASHVYEVDTNGATTLVHEFIPRMGLAMQLTDVDRDSLYEINYQFGDSTYNFEQSSSDLLPTQRQFVHAKYEYPGTAILTRESVGNLDGDLLTDFLYRGSERDTFGDPILATYVAEYSDSIHNFRRVWSTHLTTGESGIGGYEVGDFDNDVHMDFAASDFRGRVWVVEHDGDNSYSVVWRDSVPFVNVFYQGSGDIDYDGKTELFIGATISTGDWTTVFEADSNNEYSPKLLIHMLSGGTFDNPQYLTMDVDGDGRMELVVCAGKDMYILKSNVDDNYYVWYLKQDAGGGVQFYDFNKDGRKDFIKSKGEYVDPPGYFRDYADIYVATALVVVRDRQDIRWPEQAFLYANYPNPFNPTTEIRFSLPSTMHVTLTIYDLTGKEVKRLLDDRISPGEHSVRWRPEGQSSGVYMCQLCVGSATLVRKLLLLH